MRIRELTTASEVIDALGGTVRFGALIGRRKQNVSNYRASGRLPTTTILIVSDELRKIRCRASPKIWGIDDCDRRIAS